MATIPKEFESTYKNRVVKTINESDLRYLYEHEGLSCGKIAEVFGLENTIANQNLIARKLKRFNIDRRDFKGKNNPMWDGGNKKGKGGYTLTYCPDHPYSNRQGYVSEHRLVVERHIGRYLLPTEVVHHINKNRQDNRIENLQLMESNSAHAKLESHLRNRDSLGRFTS